MTPLPALDYERLYGERVLRSVMNYTRRDAEEFLELATRIPMRARVEAFPLEAASDALARVREGKMGGAAVLTMPGGS